MASRTMTIALLLAAVLVLSVTPARAAWKPGKVVTLIVPSSPGGGHDNNARVLAKFVEKHAGQPVNILNQATGGGVVAMTNMMNATPDGLTLGQISTSAVTDQYLVSGAKYTHESYKYVGMIASDPPCLMINNKKGPLAGMDFKQFVEYAKANPERVRYGVSGHWGTQDFNRYQIEKFYG